MNQSTGPGLEAKVIPACHNYNKQGRCNEGFNAEPIAFSNSTAFVCYLESPGSGLEAKVIPACHNHDKQSHENKSCSVDIQFVCLLNVWQAGITFASKPGHSDI